MSESNILALPKRAIVSYEDMDHSIPNESMTFQERPDTRRRKHAKKQKRLASHGHARPTLFCRSVSDSCASDSSHRHGSDCDHVSGSDSNRDSDSDGDEPEASFQRAVLPVATQLSNESLGPQTGEEYLLTVRREAKCLPNVFVATVKPVNKKSMPVTKIPLVHAHVHSYSLEPESAPGPGPLHIPFADDYVAYFTSLKTLFVEVSECHQNGLPVDSFHEYGRLNLFPRNLDAKAWFQWLYGKSENVSSLASILPETEIDHPIVDSDEQETTIMNENENENENENTTESMNDSNIELTMIDSTPTLIESLVESHLHPHPDDEAKFQELHLHVQFLSSLLKFDQRIVLRLLKLHETWLKLTDITELQSQWIFNLLVRLNPLLTSNEMSVLRDLCRKLLAIRQRMLKSCTDGSEDQRLKSLDMTICIITMYYGQRDLLYDL